MVSKKYWAKTTKHFLDLFRNSSEIEKYKINGHLFLIYPKVFSPKYSSDTEWFASKIIPLIKNKKFLEIGTGIGIISILAILNGAKQVVATDINPIAVKNTLENQKIHNANFSVRLGCVFDPIKLSEKFDLIFWNHPFNYFNYDAEENNDNILEASVFDERYSSLIKFFKFGKKFLLNNGKMILGTSNIARINFIKNIAKKEGYKISLIEKTIVPVSKNQKIKMDLRLYLLEMN